MAQENVLVSGVNIVIWGPGGLRKENTSDDNIQRVLLTLTLLLSDSGKHACFRGKYCYLGAPIGTPRVPDGQYVAHGLG